MIRKIALLAALAGAAAAQIIVPNPVSEVIRPARAEATAEDQTLAALDAQIQSAVILAHLISTLDKFGSFTDHLAKEYIEVYPERAVSLNRTGARMRNDEDAELDLYSSVVLELATGPGRLNVHARIGRMETQMDILGLPQHQRFLPVLRQDVDAIIAGSAWSRVQRKAAIIAIPTATVPQ